VRRGSALRARVVSRALRGGWAVRERAERLRYGARVHGRSVRPADRGGAAVQRVGSLRERALRSRHVRREGGGRSCVRRGSGVREHAVRLLHRALPRARAARGSLHGPRGLRERVLRPRPRARRGQLPRPAAGRGDLRRGSTVRRRGLHRWCLRQRDLRLAGVSAFRRVEHRALRAPPKRNAWRRKHRVSRLSGGGTRLARSTSHAVHRRMDGSDDRGAHAARVGLRWR